MANKFNEKRDFSRILTTPDKRLLKRISDETLSIEINLNFPKNCKLIKKIEEISERGLSFYMMENEGFFEKDTILKNIKIFNNEYESIIEISKVVYLKDYESNRQKKYKIGLEFLSQENVFKKRAKRFSIESINNLKTKISFTIDDEIQRAQLLNFSKYGALLLIKNPHFTLQKSETLKNFNITIDDKSIFQGDVVITDIRQKNNDFEVRIYVKEGFIPVDEVLARKNENKIDSTITKIKETLVIGEILPKEFKDEVKELASELTNLKKILDDFEENIKEEEPKIKEKFTNEMLDSLEKEFFGKMDTHLQNLDDSVKHLDVKDENYIKYLKYFQNALHGFLLLSPFINRVFYKPLGYAGDYEMMNMIYKNVPQGESLFAKVMDKYTLYIELSTANRDRIPYLLDKIKKIVLGNKGSENKRIKITSIASGPCIEIQEFMKDDLADYCDFTLLDISSEALEYSKGKLESLKKKYKRKTNFKFLNESVYEVIKKADVRDRIEKNQHFIYSSGLFEYLTENSCKRLMKVLFEKIDENGLFIIGNYSKGSNLIKYMELGGEWFLFYRSEEDLKALASNLPNIKDVFVERKGVLFLNIEKQ